MLLPAASFSDVILAIHIIGVILAFGMLFVYPLMGLVGARLEPRAMPSFWRWQWTVHMRITAPALALVLAAGIYLASDRHQWSAFYVGWGVAVVVAVGAIGGAFISPREKRLIELAERELAAVPTPAAGGGEFPWSEEYRVARRQVEAARLLQLGLVLATVFFMALHLGGS